MKELLVAVGIIMALGMVWTGDARYTGKQLKGRIADMVQWASVQLRSSAPESGLELSYQNYQRGLFNSHLQLVAKSIVGQASSWLATGQSVVSDEVVSHGPFPLASLKIFSLASMMASVHATLAKDGTSQALSEIIKDNTPFTVDAHIAYSGDSQSAIVLNTLDYAKGDEKVTFSDGQSQPDVDRNGKNTNLEGQVGSRQIDVLNEYSRKVQLRFVNLTTDGATELASFNECIGRQEIALDKLAISVEGKELALVDRMALDSGSTLTQDDRGVSSQMNYTVNSLELQGQDMGSGRLTLEVDNVDGQAWHQFSQQYSAQFQALLVKPELVQNPELYQQALTEALFNALPILLKGNPSVTVFPSSWRNAKGESTPNLSVLLGDPAQVTAPLQILADSLDRVTQSLDDKVVILVDVATESTTKITGLEGYQSTDAAKLADQRVKSLVAMGQVFRVATVEDNAISSSLQYANSQVTLNEQKMPLEDFVATFGLEMPAQSDAASQEGQPQRDDTVPQQNDATPQQDDAVPQP